MKRCVGDADLGVVMRAWFLRIFHDATSGRRGFRVLCSHLFHEKKQGSELSPEPCSETGGEGGIRTPEALIRTCTLSRGGTFFKFFLLFPFWHAMLSLLMFEGRRK